MVFACGVRWKTSSRFVSIRAAAVSRYVFFSLLFLSYLGHKEISFSFFKPFPYPDGILNMPPKLILIEFSLFSFFPLPLSLI